MLKDPFVVCICLIVVVGGIFVMWWTHSSPPLPSAMMEPQVQQSKTPLKAAVAKAARKTKATPAPVLEQPAIVEVAIPAVEAIPVVHPDPPPFPAVEKIATGLREESLTSTYGDPSLSAVTSMGGRMVETFVYARDKGRLTTVIRLEDGKVSAAYYQAEAVHATGLSAPRRWQKE